MNNTSYSYYLTWFARIVVASVFLFSAYAKWIAPGGFEIYLIDQGLAGQRSTAAVFARIIIGLELALGLSFLQPYYVKYVVTPVVAGVLIIFSVYLGYARFVLGVTGNCGCFGEVLTMTPIEAIVKNLFLLIVLGGMYPYMPSTNRRWNVPGGVLVLGILLSFLTLPMSGSPDNAFSEFTQFEGAGRVDLTTGEHLVMLVDAECPHCRETTRELGNMKRGEVHLPNVYFLIYGAPTMEDVNAFWRATNTRFPFRRVSRDTFMNLLKKQLPTVYLLREGVVREVWDDRQAERIRDAFSSG